MNIAWPLAGGIAMGACFFGGLWLTVRALVTSTHPVTLSLVSFWGRTGMVLAGFLLISRGGWRSMAAALAGFALGRAIVSIAVRRQRCT